MKPHKHAHLAAQYATDLSEDNTAYRKWQYRRIGAMVDTAYAATSAAALD